ncbi:uncharacterized protein LOC122293605 [Carya illinoinensis]|uniref:uncharacterized protein LOC122293605 n=1 Tax=Carya illinoinensis TaxID=32201 RepID=UPI001C71F50F|nr:uncharacterized protein LOC122293605 [Carya illinoinensis]
MAPGSEAENVNSYSNIGDHFVVIVEGERIEMELNNLDQPIKKQDSKVVRPDDKLDVFKKIDTKGFGEKWKDYKHELKKKLLNEKDTFAAQVVARASPDMVDLEQLAELANLWFDLEYMKKSTGTLSSRAQLFVQTHKKKDDTHYNDDTRKKVVEMEELLTQDTNSIEMRSGGTMTWASDDVYSKVMGPEWPGCVRGLGFGPTPTRKTCQHLPPTSSQEDGISKEEFNRMRNKLIELWNLVNTFVHAQASGQNQKENEEEEKDEEEEENNKDDD